MEEAGELDLRKHVVDSEYPLASRQLRKFLGNLHVIDKVHIALLGNCHLATLYLPAGVSQDIEVTTETEVLLVVRQEVQMKALVIVDEKCIFDIIAVERDSSTTNGRGEGILQKTNLIVVDVHIGENILQHSVQNITRLHKVVHAR